MFTCLGIESTAHTFGVGIVSGKKILANEKVSFTSTSAGIIPREVARFLDSHAQGVVAKALETAGIGLSDVDLISFAQGPGIGSCLQIGLNHAVALARENELPLVGVNHCVAHLEIGRLLCAARDPAFLYASGANTQVIAFEGGRYRIFGETMDIGSGNLLDKFARYIGEGFPGGPRLYELSLKSGPEHFIELPYAVKGMDLCFSGLLTDAKKKYDAGARKEDLAYSLQETAFSMLVEVSERAMAHCGKKELLLGGGVGCSKILQEKCRVMCEERGARFYAPPASVLVDNGAMIAWLGVLGKKNASKKYSAFKPKPFERTDDVEVNWR